jgi:hypothetical protein
MTKMFALFGMALILTTVVQAQSMTLETVVRTMNFTSNYSLEYFTHNEGGIPKVRFTLRYQNFDISNWGTQGQNGLWLGVGFGKQVMDGSDIIHC